MSLKRGRSNLSSEQQLDIQKQNGPFEGLKTTFSDTLGTEVIQIVVGENGDQKTFHVHKKILCDKIPHFVQLLQDNHESIIRYPEAEPNIFDVLLEWVHTDCLREVYVFEEEDEEGPTALVHRSWHTDALYLLADNLSLTELMDRAMEAGRRVDCLHDTCYLPDSIKYHYDKTSKDSKLRQYIAEFTAYTVRNDGDEFCLSTAELLSAMENEDFALDYLEISRRHTIRDPRKGSGCRFHMHNENEDCSAKYHYREGKATLLSAEEVEKKKASLSKRPRLS